MTEILLKKLDRIEKMIMEINTKIDNFLGFEELTEEEKEEVRKFREEIRGGEYVKFEELFSKSD